MNEALHFIDGQPVAFPGESAADVKSPYSGEVIGRVPVGGGEAVTRAVESSARALGAWRSRSLDERIAALDALATRVEERQESLAEMLVREVGKPIRAARIEVRTLLASFRHFQQEAPRRIRDHDLPGQDDFTPRVAMDPMGVVAAITPFNFPLLLLSWKLCPAMLTGCTVVCKPDPRTPLSTAKLAEWASELGWPPGVFNVVHGDASTGARLVDDPRVAKVAFTGSVEGGRAVYRSAAAGIKHVTLELGGCSPLVVCEDADFEAWMDAILNRAFYNSGQYCFRVNWALVDRRRYSEFREALATAASKLVAGDPADETTDLGPLIDRAAFERVVEGIEGAERCGARVLLDGRAVASERGSLIGPSVLADVPLDAAILRTETFGPVVCVVPFDDLEQAIELANGTEYGLAAFALTRDRATGARLARDLEAGTVWVNALDKSVIELPFGGVKQSGIGVEKSAWAFDEYLQPRAIYFGFPPDGHGAGGQPEEKEFSVREE
jgi:succinate-semialdehyde dehydrogenase/glutarate-semialdehyde dehydrogenase